MKSFLSHGSKFTGKFDEVRGTVALLRSSNSSNNNYQHDHRRPGHEDQLARPATSQLLPRWQLVVIAFLGFVVYHNSFQCGFAFDDVSAIKDNRDLRPQTPWTQVFANDFWGTPITKEQSHKSYRPLTILSFRLNYLLHELDPFGYHVVNVALHVLVCLLFARTCSLFMPREASFVAGLLFTVHPVHTEAVTGLVGRAETLCSIFFLLAFLCYVRATRSPGKTEWLSLLATVLFVTVATLCKEQGITVVAICAVFELFVVLNMKPRKLPRALRELLNAKALPLSVKESAARLGALIASTIFLLVLRLRVMGSQLPVFTKFDNPASAAETPARQLTFNYLLAVNGWLLLFPMDLCCDWTMGTIPLVSTLTDPRNLATLLFYVALAMLAWKAATASDGISEQILILSLSFVAFPFLPASNLFFPVGFVVAERILYIPSMGLCMVVAYGWSRLYSQATKGSEVATEKSSSYYSSLKVSLVVGLLLLLTCHSARTFIRNEDWKSEHSLFMAGLKVTQSNAKLFNNVGHALENDKNYTEALEYFLEAVRVQSDDIGAHINVGRTYNHLKQYELAERSFMKAKSLLPRARSGERYQARIAPSHLNVFLNLASLISMNTSRLAEADTLYRQAISMRADYIQAYINRGDILIRMNRTQEAREVYEKALQFDNKNADIYYNLGVVSLEQGKATQALGYFNKAIELEPFHEQALLNSAIVIQESGSVQLREVGVQRLQTLISRGKANERVYFNLGMIAMDGKKYDEGEKWFRAAIEFKSSFRSALFNLALLLSESNRSLEAVPFLKQLLAHHADHVKGLILLGDIYINHLKDLDAAEQCYTAIASIDPLHIQGRHNLCVVYVERGQLANAEHCLVEVQKLAPHEEYIGKHLRIVKERIDKLARLSSTSEQ